jgi:hypothetical protein
LSAHQHPGVLASSPRRRSRDALAALPSFADRDIDGGEWGQRTGMERRLTNMLQELSMRLDDLRETVAAPPAN